LNKKRGDGKLAIGEADGRHILESGERSRVKASEPGSISNNIGDIVSLSGDRGVTGLGQR